MKNNVECFDPLLAISWGNEIRVIRLYSVEGTHNEGFAVVF